MCNKIGVEGIFISCASSAILLKIYGIIKNLAQESQDVDW
jgi:hypothetical protein